MDELDKEVKSLEQDSWMFQGPRSRIHLISRRGLLVSLSLSASQLLKTMIDIGHFILYQKKKIDIDEIHFDRESVTYITKTLC